MVNETFQGVNIVKAYTNERFEANRFDSGITKSMQLGLKVEYTEVRLYPLLFCFYLVLFILYCGKAVV